MTDQNPIQVDDDIEEFSNEEEEQKQITKPKFRKFMRISEMKQLGLASSLFDKKIGEKPTGTQFQNTRAEAMKKIRKQAKKEEKEKKVTKKRKRTSTTKEVKATDKVRWITVGGRRTLLYNGRRLTGKSAMAIWKKYQALTKDEKDEESEEDDEYIPSEDESPKKKKKTTKKITRSTRSKKAETKTKSKQTLTKVLKKGFVVAPNDKTNVQERQASYRNSISEDVSEIGIDEEFIPNDLVWEGYGTIML